MFVDFARRLMFVHIPKTAGRTVRAHLLRHSESFANFWGETAGIDLAHLSVRESEAYLSPGFVDRATKFCFVRNPYDRLYSAFKERQYAPSFPRFVRDLYSRREFPLHCRPQHTFIHEAGRLRVERILRYEDFATEFRQLLLEFGFPVDVEAGSISDCHESSYMRHYDAPSIQAVNQLFADDFTILGYQPMWSPASRPISDFGLAPFRDGV